MKIKDAIPYVVILIVVVLIRTFLVTPVVVDGTSMDPTLSDNQVLLLRKYDHKYERYDIVVFDYNNTKLIKRVIGLPGESVRYTDGNLYINNQKVEDELAKITNDFELIGIIPEGYYFVLGDNRQHSTDSRYIGLISEENIKGTTNFSLWPIKTIK